MKFPYYKPTAIKEYLESQGASPLKRWGQNFLIEPEVVNSIVSTFTLEEYQKAETLVEIGVGLGALSHRLWEKGIPFLGFEIDRTYCQLFRENTKNLVHSVQLVEGDIRHHWNKLPTSKTLLFGNLPYHLSTEILTTCLSSMNQLLGAVFLVQKEFAERIVKEISSLSIYLSMFGDWKLIRLVPKSCFYPRPSIDSAVLLYHPQSSSLLPNPKIDKEIQILLRSLFWGKRKKMIKSLRDSPFTKEHPQLLAEFLKLCEEENIQLEQRIEEMEAKTLLGLFGKWADRSYSLANPT